MIKFQETREDMNAKQSVLVESWGLTAYNNHFILLEENNPLPLLVIKEMADLP